MADEELVPDEGVTEELPADAVQEDLPAAEEEAPAAEADLPPPKSNVWTLLLVLSCVFMMTAIIIIGAELNEYYDVKFWVLK